jgi:hypothetical protein
VHVRRAIAIAGCVAALGVGPRSAHAEGFIIEPEVIAAGVGLVLSGVALNVLSIVAQTRDRPDGRLPGGWLAVQYATAAAHLAGGFAFVAVVDDAEPRLIGSIPFILVGAMWAGFAGSNSVRRAPQDPAQDLEFVLLSPSRGLDAPARRALQSQRGLAFGVALRF